MMRGNQYQSYAKMTIYILRKILAPWQPRARARAYMLLNAVVVFVPAFGHVARAEIYTDPSVSIFNRPDLLQSENGVPIVNIVTPTPQGVSRNVYRQLDVTPQGVILNNSAGTSHTQLAGRVRGNYRLLFGGAQTIVNEINALKPMEFAGKIEVAGQAANVIIASPNGIHINGGGFINANQATLAAGKIQYGINNGSGNPTVGYRIDPRGKVRINAQGAAKGLEFQNDHAPVYANIFAQAVQLNGKITGADAVQIVLGENLIQDSKEHFGELGINAQIHNRASQKGATGVALDVGHLGGIYANSIHIVGTDAGFGVSNAGKLVANHALKLSANGQIENIGSIQAAKLHLDNQREQTKPADIVNHGSIVADALNINASQNIQGRGQLMSAKGALSLTAQGDLTMAKVSHQGSGQAALQAGKNLTVGDLNIQNQHNVLVFAADNVRIGSGDIGSQGEDALLLLTGKDVALNQLKIAATGRKSRVAIQAKNAATLENVDLSAQDHLLLSAQDITLKKTQAATRHALQMGAGRNFSLQNSTLAATAKGAQLKLQAQERMVLEDSQLASDAALALAAGQLTVKRGQLESKNASVHLEAADTGASQSTLEVTESKLQAAQNVDVVTSGNAVIRQNAIRGKNVRMSADKNLHLAWDGDKSAVDEHILLHAKGLLALDTLAQPLNANQIEALAGAVEIGAKSQLNAQNALKLTTTSGDVQLAENVALNARHGSVDIAAKGDVRAHSAHITAQHRVNLLAGKDIKLHKINTANLVKAAGGVYIGAQQGSILAAGLNIASANGTVQLSAKEDVDLSSSASQLHGKKILLQSQMANLKLRHSQLHARDTLLADAGQRLEIDDTQLDAGGNVELHGKAHVDIGNLNARTQNHLALSGGSLQVANSNLDAQGVLSSSSLGEQHLTNSRLFAGALLLKSHQMGLNLGDDVLLGAHKTDKLAQDAALQGVNGSLVLESQENLTVKAGRTLTAEGDLTLTSQKELVLATEKGNQGRDSGKTVTLKSGANVALTGTDVTLAGADIDAQGTVQIVANQNHVRIGAMQNDFDNIVATERIQFLENKLASIAAYIATLQQDAQYQELTAKGRELTEKLAALAHQKPAEPDASYQAQRDQLQHQLAQNDILIKKRGAALNVPASLETLQADQSKNQQFLSNAQKSYHGTEHKGSQIVANGDVNIFSQGGIRVEASDIQSKQGSVSLNAAGRHQETRAVIDERARAHLIRLSHNVKNAESTSEREKHLQEQLKLIKKMPLGAQNLTEDAKKALTQKREELSALAKRAAAGDSAAYRQQLALISQLPAAKEISTSIVIEGLADVYQRGNVDDAYYSLHNYNHPSNISAYQNIYINAVGATEPISSSPSGSGNQILMQGGDYVAHNGDIHIRTTGDLYLYAAQDSIQDHETHVSKRKSWGGLRRKTTITTIDTTDQIADAVDLSAKNITLQAGDNIYAYATTMYNPNGRTSIVAGDALRLFAVEDVQLSKVDSQSRSSFIGIRYSKKSATDTHQLAYQLPSTIAAEVVATNSGTDTQLQGTQFSYLTAADIQAGVGPKAQKDAKIILDVITKKVIDTHQAASNYVVWQKMADKGTVHETATLPQFNGPVRPSFSAPGGLEVQVPITEQQDKTQLVNVLKDIAKEQGFEYLQDITKRDDVDFSAFKLAQKDWNYQQQGLTPAGAALIALAVTVATGGSGGPAATSIAAAAGGGATGAAAAAAFVSLTTQASIALVNNQGDIGKTLKQMSSDATIKSLATAALSAGAVQTVMSHLPTGAQNYIRGLNPESVEYKLVNSAISGSIGAVVDVQINGGNLREQLQAALAGSLADSLQGFASGYIKDIYSTDVVRYVAHKLAHAGAGCATAALKKQECEAGAIGAAIGEMVAELFPPPEDGVEYTQKERKKIIAISQVVAGTTAAALGYDTNAAITSSEIAVTNNYLKVLSAIGKASLKTFKKVRDFQKNSKRMPSKAEFKKMVEDVGESELLDIVDNLYSIIDKNSSIKDRVLATLELVSGLDVHKGTSGSLARAKDLLRDKFNILNKHPSTVKTVNGRLPNNYAYAGRIYPASNLPKEIKGKYPAGVPFTNQGFPDFSRYAKNIKIGNKEYKGVYIKITYRESDNKAADLAAGFSAKNPRPDGYVWHHHHESGMMQLVPRDLHAAVSHTGGFANK